MLDRAICLLLDDIAKAICDSKDGVAYSGYPLRRNFASQKEAMITHLRAKVEELSNNRYTVRPAASRLLFGYISGGCAGIVRCDYNASEGEVNDRSLVQRAWFLMDGGLLPADFDRAPSESVPYERQMNGM